MRYVGARVVATLLVVVAAYGCAAWQDPAADQLPLVVVLRAVPDPHHGAFLAELRRHHHVAGRSFTVSPSDGGTAYADEDAVATALDELDRPPTLVVAYSTPYARAAAERFPDVPVVSIVNDHVATGLVREPSRPEGSITGVTYATPVDRTLELAARVLGRLERVGYLTAAGDSAVVGPRQRLLDAAEDRGVEVVEASFGGSVDVREAVTTLHDAQVDALMVGSSNAILTSLQDIESAVEPVDLPVISSNARAEFAVVVLEPDAAEVRRQVARQVARILEGDRIATIPIEDPRRFRVVLDRQRADELGLPPMPDDLLRQADEVR